MKSTFTTFIILFLVSISLVQASNPRFVYIGDEIKELTIESGKVYKNVKVLDITSEGLKVMWSGGIAVVPKKELPQYADLFADAKVEKQAEPEPAHIPQKEKENKIEKADLSTEKKLLSETWFPKTISDVKEACLIINMKTYSNGQLVSASGSGFLVNHRKQTYIYSNVHNFFGTKEFEFVFQDGSKLDLAELGPVEAADGKYGLHENINGSRVGWGGDVIRIRLKKYHAKALILDTTVLDDSLIGREIVITGNTRGKGIITELKGKITHTSEVDIIHHNAKAEAGNSGSPIVDLKTFKVLGILTWGKYDSTDPVKQVWAKKSDEERKGINSGASLARIEYKKSNFKALLNERFLLDNISKSIRLLGLMDALVPMEQGLFISSNKRVMGEYTVGELLKESPNHYIVKRLISADSKLKKHTGGIRMSKLDLFKIYLSAYRDCLSHAKKQNLAIKEHLNSRSYFFQCRLKNTYGLEINQAYQNALSQSVTWYARQRGTKAKAIQLGARIRLPQVSSGLGGLGLLPE